jgi:hypothetical protein
LCEEIFVEQLAGWFNDTTTWPRDRGFDVVCRWFDYQHHSMLIDLSDEPLIHEQDYQCKASPGSRPAQPSFGE